MDCVYICRKGENEELRYSIRSLIKHSPYKNIWLVGYKPSWYSGNFMPVEDIGGKFSNIANALKQLCDNEEISKDFILMNDDFFITKPIDSMPIFHGGLLNDKIAEYQELDPKSRYTSLLISTQNFLTSSKIKNALDYDIHVPMPMNRIALKSLVNSRYFPRSVYGNVVNLGGEPIKDVKTYAFNSQLSERSSNFLESDLPFISSEDGSFKEIYDSLLRDMFPDPSPYELR